MTRLPPGDRRSRIAALSWLVIAIVAGNTVYDLLLTRSVKEYLLRVAMFEAGRGPLIPVAPFMDVSIYDAVWKGTLAGSLLLLAALLTIRYLGPGAR